MRRPFLTLLAATAVVVVSVALFRLWHRAQAGHPEIPLGDGSVLVVEGVTWGTNQVLWLEPPPWTRFKQSLPAKWRRLTGEPQPARATHGDPSPHLWLSRRSVTTGGYLPFQALNLSSVTAEGWERSSMGHIGFGGGERAERAARFEALDWRAEALRFRIRAGTVMQDFSLPNPRRHERFPVWQPGPIPQTNFVAGFGFELLGLDTWPGTPPRWRVQWSISQGKRPATEWFDTDAVFMDPPGDRAWFALPSSEPVCQIVLTAHPSAPYPFPESQLFRLGRIPIPAPGEFVVLPMTGQTTNACLQWAVLTGSGSFTFRDGTNRVAQRPGGSPLGQSSSLGNGSWDFSFDSARPHIHLLLRGPEAGGRLLAGTTNRQDRLVLRARTSTGALVKTTGQGYSSSNDGTMVAEWRGYEFDSVPTGEMVELDLILASPIRTEFTVAAPQAK